MAELPAKAAPAETHQVPVYASLAAGDISNVPTGHSVYSYDQPPVYVSDAPTIHPSAPPYAYYTTHDMNCDSVDPNVADGHLTFSICSTVFCCFIFGIFAITKSMKARSQWRLGDVMGAKQAAEEAKHLALAALVVGFFLNIGYAIYLMHELEIVRF